MTVRGHIKNGGVVLDQPVALPDGMDVEVEVRPFVQHPKPPSGAMGRIYEILSRSYETDQPDLAERHNEHQP